MFGTESFDQYARTGTLSGAGNGGGAHLGRAARKATERGLAPTGSLRLIPSVNCRSKLADQVGLIRRSSD